MKTMKRYPPPELQRLEKIIRFYLKRFSNRMSKSGNS
jgi:hypothetical protein